MQHIARLIAASDPHRCLFQLEPWRYLSASHHRRLSSSRGCSTPGARDQRDSPAPCPGQMLQHTVAEARSGRHPGLLRPQIVSAAGNVSNGGSQACSTRVLMGSPLDWSESPCGRCHMCRPAPEGYQRVATLMREDGGFRADGLGGARFRRFRYPYEWSSPQSSQGVSAAAAHRL